MRYKYENGIVQAGNDLIVLSEVATACYKSWNEDFSYYHLYINGNQVGALINEDDLEIVRHEFFTILREYTENR